MTTLIDALKGLQSDNEYAFAEAARYDVGDWKYVAKHYREKLSEIIAEHERSETESPDLLALLQRTTKWIECFAYRAPCPENGVNLVNEANAAIAKANA